MERCCTRAPCERGVPPGTLIHFRNAWLGTREATLVSRRWPKIRLRDMPIHRGPLRSWSLAGGRGKGKLPVRKSKKVRATWHSRGVWHARNMFEERFVMRQSLGTARATDLQRAGASTRFSRQPGPTAHSGDTTVVVTYPSSQHLILPPCHS